MTNSELSPEIQQKLDKFKNDFIYRASVIYKIRPKTGSLVPFELNFAQLYIHNRLETIKKEKGFVRVVILKARQQGCSTYIAARYFDHVLFNGGLKAFILTHRQDATDNLYSLVERFYNNLPHDLQRLKIEDNAKRLVFDNDSGYGVGTAGSGEIGRSDTIQLLHLSEAAFYENASKLMTGIMQAVPEVDNTEIIIESTANGVDNMFYEMCAGENKGEDGYDFIFIPWFWDKGYKARLTEQLLLNDADILYQNTYSLNDEQMYWRAKKIAFFDKVKKETGMSGLTKFRQEYPAEPDEAFNATIDSDIFDEDLLARAFKKKNFANNARVILGVDVAGSGKDRTVICVRQGRKVLGFKEYKGLNTNQIIDEIVLAILKFNPTKVFIDRGYNPGVVEKFQQTKWASDVIGVNFGGKSDEEKYSNKRTEMYYRILEWLEDETCEMEYDKELMRELRMQKRLSPGATGKIQLMSKDELRKKFKKSPDKADALALTFAYRVFLYDDIDDLEEKYANQNYYQGDRVTGY